ncbi:MAG TPA: RNA-directed DNA polymerase [Candidatus Limihabitans stercoravium]|nr:RNA-directed DNA polymerase [Candidatus Limihabitans stercoravium]
MTYKLCRLYGLKSKKTLREWLGINDSGFFCSQNIAKNYHPYIGSKDNKIRLIEDSSFKLKHVQKKILKMLKKLDYPKYLFSGVKGLSYIDNAKQHLGKFYTYKIDVSKFFPNTSRNKVYSFFKDFLNTSPDVAKILTDCTTVDLRNYSNSKHYNKIMRFVAIAGIRQIAHLSTGASTSMLLSFCVNQSMFEELNEFCKQRDYIFTVYVDDVTISSTKPITYKDRLKIIRIVEKYGHSISRNKIKYYTLSKTKKITGVVINKNGEARTPNKLLSKTHCKILKFKRGNIGDAEINSLKGCINVAYQIDGKFIHLKKLLNLKDNLK